MNQIPAVKVPVSDRPSEIYRRFDPLSESQKRIAEQQLQENERAYIHDTLFSISKGVNLIGKQVSGLQSDDLNFDHNPITGRTQISINPKVIDEVRKAVEEAGLPSTDGKQERMVLQLVMDEEGNLTPTWDWIMLVGEGDAY